MPFSSITSASPLMTKAVKFSQPSNQVPRPRQKSTKFTGVMVTSDPSVSGSSRASSMAGRKRPRESDGDGKIRSRRTRSTGDAKDSRCSSSSAKDREAFQRSLIAVFVPKALQESKEGNMTHYNDLLAHFLPTPTMPIVTLPPLLPLLRAVSAHVSLLSPDIHGSLVSAIISLPWATGDEKFVRAFIGWAAVLVTAQPGWMKEVIGMGVKGLTWQPCFGASSTVSRRVFHARHHLLLSHLISLVPTLPNVLQPLMIRHFPNKREPEVSQTTWIRNCCELVGYCPELGGRMWGEIVDRMLRIDVEITNSLDQDDDESSDDEYGLPMAPPQSITTTLDPLDLLISQEIPRSRSASHSPEIGVDDEDSEGDPDPDDLSSVDGAESDAEDVAVNELKEAEERAKKNANTKAMREKLDGMLFHFFQHLEEYLAGRQGHPSAVEMASERMETDVKSGASTPTVDTPSIASTSLSRKQPPSPAQSLSYFQTLLNLFSRQILPTASTQHIPFLLFLTSSFSPAHTDLFLGLLVSQALYATTSTVPSINSQPVSMNQRIAATVYIGSVVCRARFVTDDQARTVLTYLLAYIDGKLHQSRVNKRHSTDELPLFYAVCQAAMLIFCFRWRAFLAGADKEGDGVLGDMEMDGDSVDDEGKTEGKWMADLDVLQNAITSDLNPLLGCNPTVVSTFAKVAHHTNFAYCFSIIEANQQSSHPRSSSSHALSKIAVPASRSSSGAGSSRQDPTFGSQTLPRQARQLNVDAGLDSYFPFDPYDLPKSKRFIETLYRTWDEVAIDGGLDSDSDSSSESESGSQAGDKSDGESSFEDHLAPKGVPLPKIKVGSYGDRRRSLWDSKQDAGLSSSLEGMSISPGRIGMGVFTS
ncbi:hypothetical protein AYX13_04613 [Cryptococcus neoformans]|nr:hypothetical protein AYX13_04613 [Cryptococcus neoformans var. grubii]